MKVVKNSLNYLKENFQISFAFLFGYLFLEIIICSFLGNPKQQILPIILLALNFIFLLIGKEDKSFGYNVQRLERFLAIVVILNFFLFFTGKIAVESQLFDVLKEHTGINWKAIILVYLGFCMLPVFNMFKINFKKAVIPLLIFSISTCFVLPILFPAPFIDLYLILKQSITDLNFLQNPYQRTFPDIYNGMYDYAYQKQPVKLVYWPLNVYLLYPFQIFFGDLRFANLFYLFLGCLILFWNFGNSRKVLFWGLALIFSCPYTFFMIKYGWIDTLAFPFFCLIFVSLKNGKSLYSFIFLGLLMALKLYYVMIFPFLVIYFLRLQNTKKDLLKYTLICCIAFLISFLPFVLTDFTSIQYSIQYFSNSKPRMDALSIVGYLYQFGKDFSTIFNLFTLGFALVMYYLFYQAKTISITKLISYISITLFTVFLLAKQSFGNYYYNIILLSVILVVFLLGKSLTPLKNQDEL